MAKVDLENIVKHQMRKTNTSLKMLRNMLGYTTGDVAEPTGLNTYDIFNAEQSRSAKFFTVLCGFYAKEMGVSIEEFYTILIMLNSIQTRMEESKADQQADQ